MRTAILINNVVGENASGLLNPIKTLTSFNLQISKVKWNCSNFLENPFGNWRLPLFPFGTEQHIPEFPSSQKLFKPSTTKGNPYGKMTSTISFSWFAVILTGLF